MPEERRRLHARLLERGPGHDGLRLNRPECDLVFDDVVVIFLLCGFASALADRPIYGRREAAPALFGTLLQSVV